MIRRSTAGEFGKVPVKAVGGPGGVHLGEHPGDGGKQDIITGPDGAMPQGLGDVAFAGSAGAHDQDGDLLLDEPAGSQVGDQGAVDVGVEGKVKLLQGLLVAEVGPAKGRGEPLLGSAGDLIGDDGGQKVHVGELLFDGLAVARFHGVQDAGQAQLLEHGDQSRA